MLTFLISVTIAALICWAFETYCKVANELPSQPDEFTQDWQVLKNEFVEIKECIRDLGWKILIPLTPLIGLICLVWWAVTRNAH